MDYNPNVGIDLHIHTTASDGSLTPTELVNLAHRLHLEAFSITDHDTIEGAKKVLRSALPPDLKFVPGIEMSSAPPKPFGLSGSLHLLGYGIDVDHPGLNRLIVELRKSRDHRTPKILDCLSRLGIQINMADVENYAGDSLIGRPHIAAVMVAKGYASSVDEAFDIYLGKGKPAYVDKARIPCHTALETIRAAGGVSVLAHPFIVNQNFTIIEKLVDFLIPLGLCGIECIYPEHPPEATAFYQDLANRKGLIITGGTDYHGAEIRAGIQIGSAGGDFYVPYDLYQKLMAKLQDYQPSLKT